MKADITALDFYSAVFQILVVSCIVLFLNIIKANFKVCCTFNLNKDKNYFTDNDQSPQKLL